MFLAVLAFTALFGAGTAMAGEYVVQSGDCLSKVGKKISIRWKELARQNNISPPYVIHPGQKLVYGGEAVVSPAQDHNFQVRHLGRNPFRGQGDSERAWTQFGLSDEEKTELRQKIKTGDFRTDFVRNGDKFDLGLEGKNVLQEKPEMMWVDHEDSQLEGAKVYMLSSGKEIWILLKCGNPYLRIKSEAPPAKIGQPGGGFQYVPGGQGEGRKIELYYIPPVESELTIEHEPIIGAWIWENSLAEGKGWYAEYMAYLRQESIYGYADGWSPGIGLYYMQSDGSSKKSSYTWDEEVFGFQAGLKYTDPDFQFQTKLRLVWEDMDGRNDEGYSMHQENVKLGFYSEYLNWEYLKDGWHWGITAEGWLALDETIKSTWSGDSPSERGQLAINFLVQKELSEDWQARLAVGPFYQEWDELFGLRAQAELRWKEIIMFGPWVSVFPFGLSDVYEGVASASDLTTLGFFVRIELAGILRAADRERRMNVIKEGDRQWLDDLIEKYDES